jgi:hypothetical protein
MVLHPSTWRSVWCLALAVQFAAAKAAQPAATDEFTELQTQLVVHKQWNLPRLEKEALRKESLILDNDTTPVDVVYRRTRTLLNHLKAQPKAPDFAAEAAALDMLRPVESESATQQRAHFAKLTAVRRQIAFKNPLLDFDKIVFLKHDKQVRGARHMIDQYFGFNASTTGGIYILEQPFSAQPVVRSLLAGQHVTAGRLKGRALENNGSFISLDLDYDGKALLFAFTEADYKLPPGVACDTNYWQAADAKREPAHAFYHFRPESCYHLFRMAVDGSGLTQLTDGPWNDFDPCFLPGGRVAFVSTRAGGQCRCGFRPDPTYTLHAAQPDGSDVIQLSFHDTNEWHPSVDHNGMLVYTRWDYVDRDSDVAHHLWHCYPDGRDPRSAHGNYPDRRELRPWMEMSIRAVPGSRKYVAVAAPHHGEAYGSLVLIDLNEQDDRACGQLKRLTPEVPFPESESAPGMPHKKGKHAPAAEFYGSPWPLSEDFHLVVFDAGQHNYGLYLLDSFGNRELLYRDPAIACLDPIPLRPRARPPVLPVQTTQAEADRPAGAPPAASGAVLVMNAYESDLPWPAGTKIKELRVINLFPKDNSIANEPHIGHAAQSLARGVLGTAPVEADGSAYFKVPTGAGIYFQVLDETGRAIHTMRSATYLHPGETLTCIGCHENKRTSAGNAATRQPLALRRPPSPLKPEAEGSYPLTFARLVQPVLNNRCLACHDQNQKKAPSLHGDRFIKKDGWSEAFASLNKFAWGMSGGNGVAVQERQYSIPGQDGARVSKLGQMLRRGHHEVELTANELRRIELWLDCNSNFYGAYHDLAAQARGEIVQPKLGLPRWTPFEQLVH